jgi:septal ring-binding cell division protein DamX
MKEVRRQRSEVRSLKTEDRKSKYSDFYILYSIFFLLMTSCQAQKQSSSSHYEDLSALRPKVKTEEIAKKDSIIPPKTVTMVTPTHTVNAKVDAILDSISRFNSTRTFVDGFTIQIYSGQKKDDALGTNTKLLESGIHLKANVQYQPPKFKVTVGKYFTRIEAQKDLLRLKRNFSSAILVPEKIMIK